MPLPEIKPIEGIDLDIEDTCQDKCKRCLKDWKWKWVVCFFIIVAVMGLAIHLLTEEHKRLDDEINARTYRLDDVDSCALHPGIAEDPWALPPVLYFDDASFAPPSPLHLPALPAQFFAPAAPTLQAALAAPKGRRRHSDRPNRDRGQFWALGA